jgi:ribosomal protein S7
MKLKLFLKRLEKNKINYDQLIQLGFRFRKAFINKIIKRGLKLKAINLFRKIKIELKTQLNNKFSPDLLIEICFMKLTPLIYFKALRKGRSIINIPYLINETKQVVYPMKWFFQAKNKSKKKTSFIFMKIDLIKQTLMNTGPAINKKIELELLALKNRHLLKYHR